MGASAGGIPGLGIVLSAVAKNVFKTPTPPEAPKTIAPETPVVQTAVAEVAQRRQRGKGYRSTILSQQMLAPDAAALKQTIGS